MYLFTLEEKISLNTKHGYWTVSKVGTKEHTNDSCTALFHRSAQCSRAKQEDRALFHGALRSQQVTAVSFSMVLSSVSKWLLCFLSFCLCCYCWWNRYLRQSVKKNKRCITWLFPLNLSVTTRNITKWQFICNHHQSSYSTIITAHFK